MPILVHEKTFHLFNNKISYVLEVAEDQHIACVYYGRRINDNSALVTHFSDEYREGITTNIPEPSCFSPNLMRAEYPCYGTGDYRTPAIEIQNENNGSYVCDFRYSSYRILKGKKDILPLPSTYVETEDEAETLEITMHDSILSTDIILTYTIFRDYAAITRHTEFIHRGEGSIRILRAMSMNLDFETSDYKMLQLSGAWGRERYVKIRDIESGVQAIQGIDGTCGGNEQNPFITLMDSETTEDYGDAYGFSLVYSGNFLGLVQVSSFGMTRVMMGINPINFSWTLKQNESFMTPEVVMVSLKS